MPRPPNALNGRLALRGLAANFCEPYHIYPLTFDIFVQSAHQQQHDEQQQHPHPVEHFEPTQKTLIRLGQIIHAAIRAETARFARWSQDEKGAGGNRRPLAARRSR